MSKDTIITALLFAALGFWAGSVKGSWALTAALGGPDQVLRLLDERMAARQSAKEVI